MKGVEKRKESKEIQLTEGKPSQEEKGHLYLDLTHTQSDHDSWLIEFGVSYHMTQHREWFCEFKFFGGGDILLEDDLLTKIVG